LLRFPTFKELLRITQSINCILPIFLFASSANLIFGLKFLWELPKKKKPRILRGFLYRFWADEQKAPLQGAF